MLSNINGKLSPRPLYGWTYVLPKFYFHDKNKQDFSTIVVLFLGWPFILNSWIVKDNLVKQNIFGLYSSREIQNINARLSATVKKLAAWLGLKQVVDLTTMHAGNTKRDEEGPSAAQLKMVTPSRCLITPQSNTLSQTSSETWSGAHAYPEHTVPSRMISQPFRS